MLKQRKGFTLIELLIVIVIIGILAAIAIPKFGATREKAYEKAMMSDLRNLSAQQELYYSDLNNNYQYADDLTDLPEFQESSGVTVTVTGGSGLGWGATASHSATTVTCGIAAGDSSFIAGASPASDLGVVRCQ